MSVCLRPAAGLLLPVSSMKLMMLTDGVDDATSDNVTATRKSSLLAKDQQVPTLRLCQLISWPSYGGYGFDVMTVQRPPLRTSTSSSTTRGSSGHQRSGHFIGKVNLVVMQFVSVALCN